MVDMPRNSTFIESDNNVDAPFLNVLFNNFRNQGRVPPHMWIVL